MTDYTNWEELEDEAYEESIISKKKPKRKKKSWKEIKANESKFNKRNKKSGKVWSNHPNRI